MHTEFWGSKCNHPSTGMCSDCKSKFTLIDACFCNIYTKISLLNSIVWNLNGCDRITTLNLNRHVNTELWMVNENSFATTINAEIVFNEWKQSFYQLIENVANTLHVALIQINRKQFDCNAIMLYFNGIWNVLLAISTIYSEPLVSCFTFYKSHFAFCMLACSLLWAYSPTIVRYIWWNHKMSAQRRPWTTSCIKSYCVCCLTILYCNGPCKNNKDRKRYNEQITILMVWDRIECRLFN